MTRARRYPGLNSGYQRTDRPPFSRRDAAATIIMANSKDEYRLVFFSAIEDLAAVRELICSVTGAHPTDATQWLARAPGVWPWPLDKPTTQKLLDGLFRLEVAAEAWRVDKFPNLSPPRPIREAACLPDGLKILGARGETVHWAPWDKIELLSAGFIRREDDYLDTQPPKFTGLVEAGLMLFRRRAALDRRQRSTRVPKDPVGEIHIVRRDPLLCLKAVEGQTIFSSLTAARKAETPREAFLRFLKALSAQADEAYLSKSTRILLGFEESDDPEDTMFDSSHEMLEHSTLRLLWSWYRKDREKTG